MVKKITKLLLLLYANMAYATVFKMHQQRGEFHHQEEIPSKRLSHYVTAHQVTSPPDLTWVECPDKEVMCPDGNTCCMMTSGKYGCCPVPNAVCCPDKVHCCPAGTVCDKTSGKCNPSIPVIFTGTKNKKIENEVQYKNEHNGNEHNNELSSYPGSGFMCPNHLTMCAEQQTCCKMKGINQYGCCPFPWAVCCADFTHCCPQHYQCDMNRELCVSKDGKSIIHWEPSE